MRTSRRVGADPLGRGLGDRPDGDRVVVRAGGAADQLLEQRVGDVAELEQADAGDDAEGVLEERQAAAQEEAGHQAPAGPPEAVAADQLDRLVLPQTRGPGHHEDTSSAAVAPTLISLVRVRTSLSVSTPAAVPPMITRKWEIPVPRAMHVRSERPKVTISAKCGL